MNDDRKVAVAEVDMESETIEVTDAPDTAGKEVAVYEFTPEVVLDVQEPDQIKAIRPDFLTDEENVEIRTQAKELAEQVLANPTDVSITSVVYALGGDAMETNTVQTDLMDVKMGPVMKTVASESPVRRNLLELKTTFDLITPKKVATTEAEFETTVEKAKFLIKAFGTETIKKIVRRLPVGDKEVMMVINSRRDSVADVINGVKRHLLGERDVALRQAMALAQIANKLYETQGDLQRATYQGQLIWEHLNEARETITDSVKSQALLYLVNDLSMLVVDIQSVDQLNMQTRMGAETLIRNCRGIQNLVSRITNRLLPAVYNALMVKAAAMQQASLAAANRDVIQAANATMAQTAKDIGTVAVQVARMNTESMLDMNTLEETQKEYEKMEIELLEIMQTAEANARGISNRMTDINKRSRQHADPLTQARQAKEKAEAV